MTDFIQHLKTYGAVMFGSDYWNDPNKNAVSISYRFKLCELIQDNNILGKAYFPEYSNDDVKISISKYKKHGSLYAFFATNGNYLCQSKDYDLDISVIFDIDKKLLHRFAAKTRKAALILNQAITNFSRVRDSQTGNFPTALKIMYPINMKSVVITSDTMQAGLTSLYCGIEFDCAQLLDIGYEFVKSDSENLDILGHLEFNISFIENPNVLSPTAEDFTGCTYCAVGKPLSDGNICRDVKKDCKEFHCLGCRCSSYEHKTNEPSFDLPDSPIVNSKRKRS